MNLVELQQEAEKVVELEYDAWSTMTGAERKGLIIQTMLKLLEEKEGELFRAKLLVARSAWETKAFAATGETLTRFLCGAGGHYQNADGRPSGVAYDLANFVSIVWDALEDSGYNPLEIATSGWSKARVTVATIRKSLLLKDIDGNETEVPEMAAEVHIRDQAAIDKVVRLASDEDVTVTDMMGQVQERKVNRFGMVARLESDGTWKVAAHVTEKQFNLLQRLLRHHAEIELEG